MIDNNRFRGLDRAVLLGGADAGLFLRQVRERQQISRQFVAERVGMSKDTVKRLERGRPCTTLQTAIDVGSVLGCEIEIRQKAAL